MNLTVRDAAELLNHSEKTIYRWLSQGMLPAYRINGQYRFNRAELLEWATTRRVNISHELFAEEEGADVALPSLLDVLDASAIHYRVSGTTKEEVLGSVVRLLQLPDDVDRNFLLSVLLAREGMGSTAVGDGIAIPHVRNPIVLGVPRAAVTLCFLEQPIDYDALDGQPVHTLFTLVSPTVRVHLHLLSRLAFVLRDAGCREVLCRQGAREEILAAVQGVEAGLSSGGPSGRSSS